jgi:Phage portal protein, SPP1 Gp6-like
MITSQILSTEVQSIASGNDIYNTYKPVWQRLLESYLGGEDYRRANNLIRYQLETNAEYANRLLNTPLENHCKSIVNTYVSFLFREEPDRDWGSLDALPELELFLEDADYEGRSWDNFMKEVAVWSTVYGHCWVLCVKPNIGAQTRADEQSVGLRPYVSLLSPLVVLDWQFQRTPIGRYELVYFKYLEDVNGDVKTIKEWSPTSITTSTIDERARKILSQVEEVNGLGMIPAVIAYSTRSIVRGIGVSDIQDIADAQRMIYNCLSEIDQSVRLDSHPSLVTPTEVQVAGTGAGSLIQIPDNMDPGLKPYVLDFGGANVDNILKTIKHLTEVIDKMASTGAIRTTETRTNSGIAIQTEFELLAARLSEKADQMELVEEQIFQIIAGYYDLTWDGEIEYPDSFNIRDEGLELTKLEQARRIATDPSVLALIDQRLIDLMEFDEYAVEGEEMMPTTEENRQSHIQQMIMDGYTDEEIRAQHPEITQADIDGAKRALLDLEA